MKLKLSISLFLFCVLTTFGQMQTAEKTQNNTIPVSKEVSLGLDGYDMTKHNRPRQLESPFQDTTNSVLSRNFDYTPQNLNNNQDIEPFAGINIARWGVINDIETNGEVLYSSKRTGNTFTVKTYDDDIAVVENFSIEVPESANQVDVLNHQSSNYFSDDAMKEYMIYVHYFEGENPGPEDQIWEVWVVKSDGTILQELTGTSGEVKTDANGNKKLYTYFNDDTTVSIKAFNTSTWAVENTYSFDSELVNFFMGIPFQFVNVDGQDYAVVARYKHLFMDNATLEVYPDNNLIIKLLDLDLNEVKTMTLDIESRYPNAGQYVIPRADFGQFYRDNTYDISSDIFNPDAELEVVYGISYYDMIGDNEWSTFMVADENGTMLNELNEYIIANFKGMQSIDGQDNQLGFLMGEGGNATTLAFFDIESWSFQLMLDAQYNGDQLSNKFNRVPAGDAYNYLIGIGEPDEENGNLFGVINEYDMDGESIERHQFALPDDVVLFDPVLTRYALIPNLYTTEDDDRRFMYTYKQSNPDGSKFNNLVIAKDATNVLVEFRGNTPKGNITGSNFLTDGNGTFNKMTVQYEMSAEGMQTDFYRLPFESDLGVDNSSEIRFSFYPNPTKGMLNIQSNLQVKDMQVYTISGKLAMEKSFSTMQRSVNLSALQTGVYLAHFSLENGTTKKIKFIKK